MPDKSSGHMTCNFALLKFIRQTGFSKRFCCDSDLTTSATFSPPTLKIFLLSFRVCTICCLRSERGREHLHTWALTHGWAGQQTRSRRTRRADTVWCHLLLLDSRHYASSPAHRKIVFPWSLISGFFCAAPFKIGCYCSSLNYGSL